jgi:hypothetical protein
MEFLLAAIVLAVLLLPAGLLREVTSSLGWSPDNSGWTEPVEALDDAPGVLDDSDVDGGLLTLAFVRRRLDRLADEIAHIDDDEGLMARAFRKTVAQTAYEALLVDETRLAQAPSLHIEAALGFEMVDEPVGASQEWAR